MPETDEEQRLRDRVRSKREAEERWRSRIQAKNRGRSRSPPGTYYDDRRRAPRGRSGPRRDEFDRRPRRRSYSRSSSRSSYSSSSSTSSSGSSRSSYSSQSGKGGRSSDEESSVEDQTYNKDQRTVLINQLTKKVTERDLEKFFKKKKFKIRDIILLRDKRTGAHKGIAYVELKHMKDMTPVLQFSGIAPSFQRFPILIKASEAEKNYVNVAAGPTHVVAPEKKPPLRDAAGKVVRAQKVYVGNLEVSQVTARHLQALFEPFGVLEEVQLQPGKGFGFLQFHDPKSAALAIQSMGGQMIAGRPIKTGWASATNPSVVTSEDFPEDASARIQQAYAILGQLTANPSMVAPATASTAPVADSANGSRIATVAEARASLAAQSVAPLPVVAPPPPTHVVPSPSQDPSQIGNADHPTNSLLIYNMFDKDKETEPGWPKEIKEEFREECSKYGKVVVCAVASREANGKIYATFGSGAQKCASTMAGRWFDQRQLRVEYISDKEVLEKAKEYESTN